MSYYGGFYKASSSPRSFKLQRSDSQDSLSAPLFMEEPPRADDMMMKSYGGVDGNGAPTKEGGVPNKRRNSVNFRKSLGARLEKRREMIVIHRLAVDAVCCLALLGIIIMMIETEMFLNQLSDKESTLSYVFKTCISVTTFFLLVGICMDYYIALQIKALDAGVRDWHAMIKDTTWFCLILELLVCAIHPFPGDVRITYTSPTGLSRRVSIDAILSILMMSRLYLIAKFAVVHSPLLTDASVSSIGALSKIKINTVFVFKAAMTNAPSRLLLSVMITTFFVNSWAMRTCEIYYRSDNNSQSYLDVMWLVATTFLTVGYGDTIPQSYCGRYISICTGIMGVGSTALLVAVFARQLEQSRSERYVFNMVTRIQIEKRRKHAAANVIKSVIQLWMIRKYSKQEKSLRRKYQDQLKTSLRQMHVAKADKAHVDEFNVGIIEVSEMVNRINSSVERLEAHQEAIVRKRSKTESRMSGLENKLDEIKSLLTFKQKFSI